VINSNCDPISHRLQDTATFSLKRSIENCSQIAADETSLLLTGSYRSCQRLIRWYHCRHLRLTV